MNKWMKQGMTTLILGASAFTAQTSTAKDTDIAIDKLPEYISIDATDYFCGSKLKDRMYDDIDESGVEIFRVLIDA